MLLFHTSVIFELTNRAISGMLLFYTQQVTAAIVVTPRRSSLHPVATSGSPCPGILLMVLGLGHHCNLQVRLVLAEFPVRDRNATWIFTVGRSHARAPGRLRL